MALKAEQKSKKKKRLTEEEKQALKLEKQQKILRDQVEREANFAKLSHERSEKPLIKVAENFKIDSLAVEKSAAIQWSHHQVANAENEIDKLEDNRQHLFDHLSRAQNAQVELIKNIKDLFHLFQNSLRSLFEKNRKNLVDDFFAEKIVLERFLHDGKRNYENYAHEFLSALQKSLKNQTDKLIDDKIAIRAGTLIQTERIYSKQNEFEEKIIEQLDDMYKTFIWVWPKERNERYQVTLKESIEIQAEIEELASAEDNAENELFELESLWEEKEMVWAGKVLGLNNYCDYIERMYKNIRIIEKQALHQDNEKLKALSMLSLKTSKYLQKNLKTLENILMLMKVCKKYESIEDRIKFIDQPVSNSESLDDLKSFNRKLSQNSLNFTFRNSSIFTNPTSSKLGGKNSACFHKKKLRSNAINNQSCLKSLENSEDTNNIQIDGNERTSSADNNPLSFLRIYSSPDFNAYYPTDDETNEKVASKFTAESNLSVKYPSHASSSDDSPINDFIVNEFYRKVTIIKADCLLLKNYKEKMTKNNENLRKLLASKRHEFGVKQNLQKLRLNSSPSIGNIYQVSHQIPQIQEEIIIRKCRSMHLKVNRLNKVG